MQCWRGLVYAVGFAGADLDSYDEAARYRNGFKRNAVKTVVKYLRPKTPGYTEVLNTLVVRR
jgi:hypothetical protein